MEAYNNPGNPYSDDPDAPQSEIYGVDGSLDDCAAIQRCAGIASQYRIRISGHFDVHFVTVDPISDPYWLCIVDPGPNTDASYFNVYDPTIGHSYGYSQLPLGE